MAALATLGWAGMSGSAFASGNAFACSNSDHCWAQAEKDDIPNNTGIQDYLNIQCLYYPDTTNFATNEEWEQNGTYWVEAGVVSGYDYYGNIMIRTGTGRTRGLTGAGTRSTMTAAGSRLSPA
jgi:hypothetical protein